ncbi:MAG: hypothetical protein RBT68_06910 [Spirochaetia bacterium]|jgi:hypothetical protein|nr:hypothetical protein [Spirochaetia bacterium]
MMYEKGRISTLEDLKRVYRLLAKRIHPDILGTTTANERFVRLKDEFDVCAARIVRDAIGIHPLRADTLSIKSHRVYSRRDIIELLIEIEATGFFLNDGRTRRSRLYHDRLVRFNRILGTLGIDQVHDIFNIEKSLCRLRVEDDDIYESVKLVMYNIVAYHYEPRRFILESTTKLHEEIQNFSNREAYAELYAFMGWLIADMAAGSVFEGATVG